MRNAKWNLGEPLGAGVASVSPAAEVHLSVVRPLPSVCQVWGRGQAENPTTSATMLRDTCYFWQLQNKHHSEPLQDCLLRAASHSLPCPPSLVRHRGRWPSMPIPPLLALIWNPNGVHY